MGRLCRGSFVSSVSSCRVWQGRFVFIAISILGQGCPLSNARFGRQKGKESCHRGLAVGLSGREAFWSAPTCRRFGAVRGHHPSPVAAPLRRVDRPKPGGKPVGREIPPSPGFGGTGRSEPRRAAECPPYLLQCHRSSALSADSRCLVCRSSSVVWLPLPKRLVSKRLRSRAFGPTRSRLLALPTAYRKTVLDYGKS